MVCTCTAPGNRRWFGSVHRGTASGKVKVEGMVLVLARRRRHRRRRRRRRRLRLPRS